MASTCQWTSPLSRFIKWWCQPLWLMMSSAMSTALKFSSFSSSTGPCRTEFSDVGFDFIDVGTIFFLVCLSLIRMSGPNLTKTPSLFADPSNEGYNCNKTWLLLPNYYRTDVLRPSTFRWFGGLLSLLITAHWAEILGLSRLRISVLLVGGP